jgi:hypothetical protein
MEIDNSTGAQCDQWGQITAESEAAFGIIAKPQTIFGEYWLVRLFENKCSGTAEFFF